MKISAEYSRTCSFVRLQVLWLCSIVLIIFLLLKSIFNGTAESSQTFMWQPNEQMNKWQTNISRISIREKQQFQKKERKSGVCVFSSLLWIGYKVNIINRVAFRWFVPHWISNQVKSTLVCTIMMASSVRNLYCAVGWKQKRIRNNNQSSIKWHWNHSRANTPLDAPLPWRKMYPTNVSISIWIVDSIH